MQEMIDKELETRTEGPPHEVYGCELETKHSDKSITKVINKITTCRYRKRSYSVESWNLKLDNIIGFNKS